MMGFWYNNFVAEEVFANPKVPVKGEGPFFTDYLWKAQTQVDVGIEFINWNETKYPKLAEHKEDIISIFNTHYKYRELGAETESRFNDNLQARFNEIADKYNHAYKVTEENDVDRLGTGYTFDELRKRNIESEGTASGNETRDSKYKDTPSSSTSTINNPTNQNIDNRDNSSTATTKEAQTDEVHQEKIQHDKEMVVELSELIDKYRQLDIEFIYQFENCFIGIFGGNL